MQYSETVRDLFSVDQNYYLAHCISADFALGAGIAVQFNKRFDMKNKLKRCYPNYIGYYDAQVSKGISGSCIIEGKVLNLITKRNYWNKPTYKSLEDALLNMKHICKIHNIKKIAMPLIGCGLDRLEWYKVSALVKRLFSDTDIEILVCKL